MNTLRGSLIYTAFATLVFLGIQWWDGVRAPQDLIFGCLLFFAFTFFMLRLIQRVLAIVIKPNEGRRRGRGEREPGPAVIEATTDRPEHNRRRREARRTRGRRR